MSSVIQVEGISKSYLIQHKQSTNYRSLREEIMFGLNKALRRSQPSEINRQTTNEIFWALDDVSFSIEAGECVGFIGRNGAGKSTLLKILSRITKPTKGKIQLVGKLGSLLEVGTGFHPELTGRENIYLNGAILGMSSTEIRKKFDEIVEFAEIDKFLDTPVKRYSSGMYVKLAFSIAAHLEPDLLILDEVLAVGDHRFQQKCFDQIRKMGKESGRAVILVSHNMTAISNICSRCLLLENGKLIADGETTDVLAKYVSQGNKLDIGRVIDLSMWPAREGNADLGKVSWIQIDTPSTDYRNIYIGSDLVVRFAVVLNKKISSNRLKLSLVLNLAHGATIANMVNTDSGFVIDNVEGENVFEVTLENIRLYPGEYNLSIWLGDSASSTIDYVIDCARFEISEGGPLVNRALPRNGGLLFLTPAWKSLNA